MEASVPPVPPVPPQDYERGFFEALMDTRFENLITPKLVSFVYIVGMIVLAIGTVIAVIAGFADSAGTGVLFLIIAPLIALLYLIVLRLWLELIVVAFKIRDAADTIADNTR